MPRTEEVNKSRHDVQKNRRTSRSGVGMLIPRTRDKKRVDFGKQRKEKLEKKANTLCIPNWKQNRRKVSEGEGMKRCDKNAVEDAVAQTII